MLYELMGNEVASPLYGFGVVLAGACGAPSPDVAVGAVRCCLAGIQSAAVEVTLVRVGPQTGVVLCASLQLIERAALEILDAADGAV